MYVELYLQRLWGLLFNIVQPDLPKLRSVLQWFPSKIPSVPSGPYQKFRHSAVPACWRCIHPLLQSTRLFNCSALGVQRDALISFHMIHQHFFRTKLRKEALCFLSENTKANTCQAHCSYFSKRAVGHAKIWNPHLGSKTRPCFFLLRFSFVEASPCSSELLPI